MTGRDLDSLAALARDASPAIAPEDDARVVSAAMLAGAARHRRRIVSRVAFAALALAAAAALGVVVSSTREPSALTRLELASGDVLTAVPGARFVVEPGETGARRLRLNRGAMLFDVKPLAAGERFEVVTRDATVRVVGTVFAVETSESGTSVRVFEGRVEVRDASGLHVLRAGESLGAASGATTQLEPSGRDAAARRAAAVPVRVATRDVPSAAVRAAVPAPVLPPAPVAAPVIAQRPETRDAPPVDPSMVRDWIADGRAEDALRIAHAHDGGAWRFAEADALRALRRFDEAALAYDDAARLLDGEPRAQAAYLAATLHATELGEPAAALASLDAAGVDTPGAPLRERGLALRASALAALHRDAELREVAQTYLDSYPRGSRAAFMRARLSEPDGH